MTQNVWEQEAVKDLVQLEEGEFNLCDFALFLSVILELLEENGPVSEKTRNMILSETDMERLSVWLKAAARSGSEEDFLSRIC